VVAFATILDRATSPWTSCFALANTATRRRRRDQHSRSMVDACGTLISINIVPCGRRSADELLFIIIDGDAFDRVIRIFLATGLGPIAEIDVVAIGQMRTSTNPDQRMRGSSACAKGSNRRRTSPHGPPAKVAGLPGSTSSLLDRNPPAHGEVVRLSRDGGVNDVFCSVSSPSVMPPACHLPLAGEELSSSTS
jgi:hypothetical protein